MSLYRIFAVGVVFVAVSIAWMLLGLRMTSRSMMAKHQMGEEVRDVWGPGLQQPHIKLSGGGDSVYLRSTQVAVDLKYQPQKRGLLWHRTYDAAMQIQAVLVNTSATAQNVRVQLELPSTSTSYDQFKFQLGHDAKAETRVAAKDGLVETAVMLPAGAEVPLNVAYKARGLDRWAYVFEPGTRLRDFTLRMNTDFDEISFPVSSSSPTSRQPADKGDGWALEWRYEDVLEARNMAMDMPGVLNSGPVVAKITFFAPLALMLFFGVVLVVGLLRGVALHPVQYAFVAAGFFSFHALLGYMVDVLPLGVSFVFATLVSMTLASGYIHLVKGRELSYPAAAAQLVYLVLFSFSFFFEGFTGLTLTVLGVATLAGLMWATAKVNWEQLSDNLPPLTWWKNMFPSSGAKA